MGDVGTWGVIALIVIVLALAGWMLVLMRAERDPVQTKEPGGELKRGPVSGGAIRGDPGQVILTGDAPRQETPSQEDSDQAEPRKRGPLDL